MARAISARSRAKHAAASLVRAYHGARAEYHQLGLALFRSKHDGMTPREWAKHVRKRKVK